MDLSRFDLVWEIGTNAGCERAVVVRADSRKLREIPLTGLPAMHFGLHKIKGQFEGRSLGLRPGSRTLSVYMNSALDGGLLPTTRYTCVVVDVCAASIRHVHSVDQIGGFQPINSERQSYKRQVVVGSVGPTPKAIGLVLQLVPMVNAKTAHQVINGQHTSIDPVPS